MAHKLSDYPEISSGFSAVADGTMSIAQGMANRSRYLRQRAINPARVVHARLRHGAKTAVVKDRQAGQIIDQVDGLITAEPHLGLAMSAADCLLIFVYDPIQKVIGLVHAGRRGLAQQVVTEFFKTWLVAFSARAHNFMVDISPSICPAHYSVTAEQASPFVQWPEAVKKSGDLVQLNLRQIAVAQLVGVGVPKENITISTRCTFEDPQLFSYRRDRPPQSQLQVGYLMRKS